MTSKEKTEAHSLSRLCDITLPDPPDIWPLAPGLILLCILLLLPLLALSVKSIQRYRLNAYRRTGLQLLQGASSIDELQVALKRVALVAFPRPQVAPLYDTDWIHFLQSTCQGVHFTELKTNTSATPISDELRQQATRWIRYHKVPGGDV